MTTIDEARRAQAVMGLCKPFLDEMIANRVIMMIQEYRGNTATYEFLLGKVAEIAALRDFESHLETIYRRGIVNDKAS